MIKSVITALLMTATTAMATTDYTCVNDCSARGYQYNLCVSKCSYNNTGGADAAFSNLNQGINNFDPGAAYQRGQMQQLEIQRQQLEIQNMQWRR